jgi:heme/copper-type cytochrome/quinol oxidase subunit 3
MVVFVATEATLFGALAGTYLYLRFLNAHWPPPGVRDPAVLKPALLTLALVSTSLFMQLAWSSARQGRRAAAWRLLFVAFVMQSAYLVWQLHDYVHAWHAMDPQASAYSSVYLTLVGTDHLHVLAGVLMNAWFLIRIWSRLTRYRLVGLHAVTFYWHAVNAITAVVLLIQVSPHL